MDRPTQLTLDRLGAYLRNGQHDRTPVGGFSVGVFAVGGYLMGGLPGLGVGAVVGLLWGIGTPPLAIVIGSSGLTAIAEPATVSTVFGATPTTFSTPLLGVLCVGGGIVGLCLDPLVTVQQPTRVVIAAGLLIISGGAGLLVAAHLTAVPLYWTVALAGGGVLFVAGVIARTVTLSTPAQEAINE